MSRSGSGARDQLDDDIRADALDVLGDVTEWRLTAERWSRVEETVDALHDALGAGDGERFRQAVHELELSGPVRVARIGSVAPLLPASESLQGRRSHLVHALTTERGTEESAASERLSSVDETVNGLGGAGASTG